MKYAETRQSTKVTKNIRKQILTSIRRLLQTNRYNKNVWFGRRDVHVLQWDVWAEIFRCIYAQTTATENPAHPAIKRTAAMSALGTYIFSCF